MTSKVNLTTYLWEEQAFHDHMANEHYTRGDYFYQWDLSGVAIERVKSLLASPNNGYLPDYGCGELRHTLDLAWSGVPLIGVDVSFNMLQVARHKAVATDAEGNVSVV